jgi:hypothetical protein
MAWDGKVTQELVGAAAAFQQNDSLENAHKLLDSMPGAVVPVLYDAEITAAMKIVNHDRAYGKYERLLATAESLLRFLDGSTGDTPPDRGYVSSVRRDILKLISREG